jgi:hypothetical protein
MSSAIGRSVTGLVSTMTGNSYIENVLTVNVFMSGNIVGALNQNPIVITTSSPHGLVTGQHVDVSGVGGNTNANGSWLVTVLTATTFSIPATGNSNYTSGGSYSGHETMVPMGQVTQPHWSWWENYDATNYVQLFAGINGAILCRLLAGERCPLPLDPGTAPYALAVGGPVTIGYLIFSL